MSENARQVRGDDEMSIRYSEKFYSKKFSDEESKKAYLKACKWLAKYVLSKPEFKQVEFGIEKVQGKSGENTNTFELSLYAVLPEEELKERHCEICRETHKSFFISEETNCNWCKVGAYQRRADSIISIKAGYYRDCLERRLDEV